MYSGSSLAAFAAILPFTSAVFQGFNYGNVFTNGAPKAQSDFEAEFMAARTLVGAPAVGFQSARLFTMRQADSSEPISAIPAAFSTKTTLLLGLWCSAGDAIFASELDALRAAIAIYGSELGKTVVGISVGSEDLYRISPTGIKNGENPGTGPSTIAGYIKQVREVISGTSLTGTPVGHVDTWTAWVNGSNQEVIEASDFVGVDAYPYYQDTQTNSISNSRRLFFEALNVTKAAAGGKPIWVTETGFPVTGETINLAVPGVDNAKKYWDEVGCSLFGTTNTWWYTFQDAAPNPGSRSFGIVGSNLAAGPLFNISCNATDSLGSLTGNDTSGASATSTAPVTNRNGVAAVTGSLNAALVAVLAVVVAL
ncbi:hypothetical protein OQA88_7811 [Cercophora sp. LCS_1]